MGIWTGEIDMRYTWMNNRPYLKVLNSYGNSWGNNNFFYVDIGIGVDTYTMFNMYNSPTVTLNA